MNNKKILTKFFATSLIPIFLLSSNTVMGMKSSTPNTNHDIYENKSMSHDDFIKHFNEELYNKKIPYDDENMEHYYGLDERKLLNMFRDEIPSLTREDLINLWENNFSDKTRDKILARDKIFAEKVHSKIKDFIDNNSFNKELAKKVYAELMWLEKYYASTSVPIFLIMILFPCNDLEVSKLYDRFDEFYCGCYCDCFTFKLFKSNFTFIKEIYNEEIQSLFEQSLTVLFGISTKLGKTNSNRKRKIAIENINVIIDKFNALIKTNNDPTLTTLSQGMIVLLCQPIKKMIESESKPLKTPEFKQISSDSESKSKSKSKYIPIKYAGSGGFGTVEVYKDTEKNEKVAIKTLQNSFFEKFDIDLIEKLKAIKSPYVMKLREVIDLPGNKQGLVMEYIHEHIPLKDALHNTKRFTKSKVLDICMQIADGLNTFNQAGFIHPDMGQHPNNVVIDKNDQVKIIDYDNSRPLSCDNNYENNLSALKLIATALYVSYKDLYRIFLDKFSLSFDITNDFRGYPVIMGSYYKPLPTFDEIKAVLKVMKSEIEKTE